MKFIADLHIHSKYSMATARNLDLENLYVWAQKKGITVVGTGDATHPAWLGEINEKLIEETEGLYRLRPAIEKGLEKDVPRSCRGPVRFLLSGEISTIYKKNGKTRKNHNLVLLSSITAAEAFNRELDRLGNIRSDGRPILGLDTRDLLEITLETDGKALFVPAHIWTPWFSLFGSKSGFDSVEACFEDLAPRIKVLETGLSSDPAMNWQVSALDGMTLISNSDAHSPAKLGREANLFDCELNFPAMTSAMATGNPEQFLGTLEFFPQEGKYHLDGHKKCGFTCRPEESQKIDTLCPECGKPLTLGVLYRVMELADRPKGEKPKNRLPFKSLIPMTDVLAEIYRVGPNTKTVNTAYEKVINTLGPELKILADIDIECIERAGIPLLGEAVRRMRKGDVHIDAGYDGVYGKITLFSDDDRKKLVGQQKLFTAEPAKKERSHAKEDQPPAFQKEQAVKRKKLANAVVKLNPDQKKAVSHGTSPLIIAAGPGTGKTLTVTQRIARLILKKGVAPETILAVTFTNKATREIGRRLEKELGKKASLPVINTFHALCLTLLTEEAGASVQVLDDFQRRYLIQTSAKIAQARGVQTDFSIGALETALMQAKQIIDFLDTVPRMPDAADNTVLEIYQHLLAVEGVLDYEDLIRQVVWRLFQDKAYCNRLRNRFRYLFVDEYQDINEGQYQLVRLLSPENGHSLCVIGDPDQSIYGFRGSDDRFFRRFQEDFPNARKIILQHNYRSTATIVTAAGQMLQNSQAHSAQNAAHAELDELETIGFFECSSDRKEAATIARAVMNMVGGRGFHDIDTGWTAPDRDGTQKSYGDIAVLFRIRRQGRLIARAMEIAGIPYQLADRKHILDQGGLRAVLSAFRLVSGCGLYSDFETLCSVESDAPGKKSLEIFTLWGLGQQKKVAEALLLVQQAGLPGVSATRERRFRKVTDTIIALQKQLSAKPIDEKLAGLIDYVTQKQGVMEESPARQDLLARARRHKGDDASFLAGLSLLQDVDSCRFSAEKVSLLTMHAAKGLEFPVVFIAGLEDGLVPFQSDNRFRKTDVKEEQRLFYVAMTRAKEALYLSWAKKRRLFGKVENRASSPFLTPVSDTLLARQKELLKSKPRKPKQMSIF